MLVKLFVLGGPGSGKSTISRSIEGLVCGKQLCENSHASSNNMCHLSDEPWSCEKINDYPILWQMVEEEEASKLKDHRRLRRRDPDNKREGFDVLDVAVFDEALRRLEDDAEQRLRQYEQDSALHLVLIEFSRNSYEWAFQQFTRRAFFQDAYFIYLKTSINVCMQRIHCRAENPKSDDDYDVSEFIFRNYYNHDDGESLAEHLGIYGISGERILPFDNNGELTQQKIELIKNFLREPLQEQEHLLDFERVAIPA